MIKLRKEQKKSSMNDDECEKNNHNRKMKQNVKEGMREREREREREKYD
jgi:hypothetical protein